LFKRSKSERFPIDFFQKKYFKHPDKFKFVRVFFLFQNISVLLSAVFFISFTYSIHAQELPDNLLSKELNYYQYDQDFLTADFHKARRDSLRKLLPDSSIAIFFSAPERNRSNDVYYEYHQDPNFYYLSGFREPNALLIVSKEIHEFGDISSNEILFVPERDPKLEIWNGRRLGQDGAANSLGFNRVLKNSTFKEIDLNQNSIKRIYYLSPLALEEQDTSDSKYLAGLWHQFVKKNTKPFVSAENHLEMMMAQLRQDKAEEELILLKKAIEITCEAQNKLMQNIKPDMAEYETEAIIEYVFKSNGAECPGFPSIQGSGENSCILHYTSNRRPLKNGGLLVSDVGAEYRGYTADVTRTIPPSGKFSAEERAIYELVYKAQSRAIDSTLVGVSFWFPHMVAQKIIAQGLLELGIISSKSDFRKYFMHGTSHYLGLDVHDPGLYKPLKENQVITVEPGIYIAEGSDCDPKWWNIGVRIEDDILIKKEGPVILSNKSPRSIEDIEKMMGKKEDNLFKK
jgi:Xaa-Pro aminopeptidase